MDLATVLSDALDAVNKAKIPDELRPIAFGKAIEILAGSVVLPTAMARSGVSSAQSGKGVDASAQTAADNGDGGSPLVLLATKLKLDLETVEHVYDFADGAIQLVVGASKIASSKTAGTKEIALLVAAGQQGAQIEADTLLSDVRTVAESYRRYDSPNFARAINAMATEFTFKGKNNNRSIRVSRPGWEAAAELVNRMGGGES